MTTDRPSNRFRSPPLDALACPRRSAAVCPWLLLEHLREAFPAPRQAPGAAPASLSASENGPDPACPITRKLEKRVENPNPRTRI